MHVLLSPRQQGCNTNPKKFVFALPWLIFSYLTMPARQNYQLGFPTRMGFMWSILFQWHLNTLRPNKMAPFGRRKFPMRFIERKLLVYICLSPIVLLTQICVTKPNKISLILIGVSTLATAVAKYFSGIPKQLRSTYEAIRSWLAFAQVSQTFFTAPSFIIVNHHCFG